MNSTCRVPNFVNSASTLTIGYQANTHAIVIHEDDTVYD